MIRPPPIPPPFPPPPPPRSSTPPASAAGASPSCTATVTDSVATPPFATGTVNFFADGATTTAFASCSLTGTGQVQTCAVSYTTTTVGPHTIFATDQGDATQASSSRATAAAVTVTKHPTVTTVSCSPPAFAAGASTSCTATVTDSVATPPFATGTVNLDRKSVV